MQANIERADGSPPPEQEPTTVPVQRLPLEDNTDEHPAVPVGEAGEPVTDESVAEPEAESTSGDETLAVQADAEPEGDAGDPVVEEAVAAQGDADPVADEPEAESASGDEAVAV